MADVYGLENWFRQRGMAPEVRHHHDGVRPQRIIAWGRCAGLEGVGGCRSLKERSESTPVDGSSEAETLAFPLLMLLQMLSFLGLMMAQAISVEVVLRCDSLFPLLVMQQPVFFTPLMLSWSLCSLRSASSAIFDLNWAEKFLRFTMTPRPFSFRSEASPDLVLPSTNMFAAGAWEVRSRSEEEDLGIRGAGLPGRSDSARPSRDLRERPVSARPPR